MSKRVFWLIPALFAFGVVAGITFLWVTRPPSAPISADPAPRENDPVVLLESDAPPITESFESSEVLDEKSEELIQLLGQADEMLLVGNLGDATREYQRAVRKTGKWTSDVALRLGLCTEALGRRDEALRFYERAVDIASSRIHRYLAVLGMTRVRAAQRQADVVLPTMAELFLNLDQFSDVPEDVRSLVVFEYAELLRSIALKDYHDDVNRPDGVLFAPATVDIQRMLTLIQTGMFDPSEHIQDSTDAQQIPPSLTLVQRPTEDADMIYLAGRVELSPLTNLLRQLTVMTELEISVSMEAQQVIDGRARRMTVRSIPLSLMLDSMLLPLDLCWYQESGTIHVFALSELETAPARLQEYWLHATERTYRRFSVMYPGHPRMVDVLINRSALHLIRAEFDEAAKYLYELIELKPYGELLAVAFFNYGKLNAGLGRTDEAVDYFYKAVDQSVDPVIQSSGYWHVAQLKLEQGAFEEAIRAGGRSLATARHVAQRRLTALTMARAYLMKGDPASANKVLFDQRHSFVDSELYSIGAMLGAYARFLGSHDSTARTIAAERLLTALVMTPDEQYQSFIDYYLAGQAFDQLGFPDRAIQKYRLALRNTDLVPWQRRVVFELARDMLQHAPESKDAVELLEYLVQQADDQWTVQSQVLLGQYWLDREDYQTALKILHRLWQSQPELDPETRKHVLIMMGKSYSALGKHHTAAICFAGYYPPPEGAATDINSAQ